MKWLVSSPGCTRIGFKHRSVWVCAPAALLASPECLASVLNTVLAVVSATTTIRRTSRRMVIWRAAQVSRTIAPTGRKRMGLHHATFCVDTLFDLLDRLSGDSA